MTPEQILIQYAVSFENNKFIGPCWKISQGPIFDEFVKDLHSKGFKVHEIALINHSQESAKDYDEGFLVFSRRYLETIQ